MAQKNPAGHFISPPEFLAVSNRNLQWLMYGGKKFTKKIIGELTKSRPGPEN